MGEDCEVFVMMNCVNGFGVVIMVMVIFGFFVVSCLVDKLLK